MLTVRVRDVMTPARTVADTAAFSDVVDLMLRHGIGALPVVDETGALLGVVSEADLLIRPASRGDGGPAATAGTVMSAPAETVRLDDTVRDVARRMADHQRGHLPVVDNSGRLVGVVTRRNVLRMFDRADGELAADVSDALAEDGTLEGHAVSVTAKDGVITLEGTVDRVDDVAYVRRLAWMVPCVVDVVSHVTVGETASRHATKVKEVGMQHIVVGVDGSAASGRAVQWAVDRAHTCGSQVEAIHAWAVPDMGTDPLAQALADPDELEEQARRELHLVVDRADERGLVAPITRTLVQGDPAEALVRAGKGADMVVVGSRGLGDGDSVVGSVSDRVIRDAPCPVVVVPATA